MIVPDLNLLIYAIDTASPFHAKARGWWNKLVNGQETVGLPWTVTLGFVRLVTHPKMLTNPWPLDRALRTTKEWFDFPAVQPCNPGSDHMRHLSEQLRHAGVGAKLVMDAHLAALAIEYRAVLHTHDRDFERFSGVRLYDPL